MSKTYEFPLLNADDIEVRIGQVNKDGTKATLLLYQNARVGMRLLDEVVGCLNWQRQHYELKGHIYCTISLWDDEKKQWVSKSDVGSESQVEIEKGESSDSFKRACVNVGIARELYTAPTIWVSYDKNTDKYAKFEVIKISYDNNREINGLIITKNGEVVFTFGVYKQSASEKQYTEKKTVKVDDIKVGDTFDTHTLNKDRGSITEEQSKYIKAYISLITSDTQRQKFFQWLVNKFQTMSVMALSEYQADTIITTIKNRKGNN